MRGGFNISDPELRIGIVGAGAVGIALAIAFHSRGLTPSFIDVRGQAGGSSIERTLTRRGDPLQEVSFSWASHDDETRVIFFTQKLSSTFLEDVQAVLVKHTAPDIVFIQNGAGFLPESFLSEINARISFGVVSDFQGTFKPNNEIEMGNTDFRFVSNLDILPVVDLDGVLATSVSFDSNIKLRLWEKFVRWAPMSLVCGLSKIPIGKIFLDASLEEKLCRLVDEHVQMAESAGFGGLENPISRLRQVKPETMTSAAQDIAAGTQSELDTIYRWANLQGFSIGDLTRKTLETVSELRRS